MTKRTADSPLWLRFLDRRVAQVPVPALMRLPTLLRLHKPDQRLHLTSDRGALKRLLIAQKRKVPVEGIVDAYVVDGDLVLVLGDLTVRSFPTERLPGLAGREREAIQEFEIDDAGSYLRWPRMDLDLGSTRRHPGAPPVAASAARQSREPGHG